MKIMVFLHGTAIMHKAGIGVSREERVKQIVDKEKSVQEYDAYVPIGNVVAKLGNWESQGGQIVYLSSHQTTEDVEKDKLVLNKYRFPDGEIFYRKGRETYTDIVNRISPDILIEDDCESIGGESEMAYPSLKPESKQKIKSIVVKEFAGLDSLPDSINQLE
jgi:hypothetical protein